MIYFNAFQIVAAFGAWPLLVYWLNGAEFRGAGVLFWVAVVAYVVAFIFHVGSVAKSLKEIDKTL